MLSAWAAQTLHCGLDWAGVVALGCAVSGQRQPVSDGGEWSLRAGAPWGGEGGGKGDGARWSERERGRGEGAGPS
jgi:hypothetical protein